MEIQVKGKGWSHTAHFTVRLHDVKVPDLSEGKFFYTNWFNLRHMEAQHRLERWSEALIMDATNNRDGLIGAVDLWCPLINDFQENQAFFAERVAAGDKVLVYTCLIPGGQWLNRTLDLERLRQVYFGWGGGHYGNLGYLHWGLNQYQANPFTHSVVQHPSPVAGGNNFLPAGDTHIIYPGKKSSD
jgi:hypothetical protein